MTTADMESRGWVVLRRSPDVWEQKGTRVIVLDGVDGWYWQRFHDHDDAIRPYQQRGPFPTLADAVRAAEGGET